MNELRQTMGTTWKIGKLFGHRIYMQPMFLLLVAFFAFSGLRSYADALVSIILIPVIAFSILFHELAHAATSKKLGYGTSDIVLHAFGGVSINDCVKRRAPLKNALVSVMGPISSALLGSIGLVLLWYVIPSIGSEEMRYLFGRITRTFVWLNFILAVFNALPILPLDGGHVLQHVLSHFMKNDRKSMQYAIYTSMITLVAISVILVFFRFVGIWGILILGMLGLQNYKLLQSL